MRESEVEKYLVKVVESLGGTCRKVKWIGRRSAPDRVVMLPFGVSSVFVGGTIWVELKRPCEVPTAAQKREHARMRKFGQQVVVLDSIGAIDKWASEL